MLADLMEKSPRRVLVYCRGGFHLPLIEPLVAANPDIEFYLHSNLLSKEDFLASSVAARDNVFFIASFEELKFKLGCFGAFITTDAQMVLAHQYSLRLIRIFRHLGVPTLELQHGLVQLGMHYFDHPGKTRFTGDSLPSRSLADRVLSYYPAPAVANETVVGYPPYNGKKATSTGGDFVLVLTNLHWTPYSADERKMFCASVFAYAKANPDVRILWRQHHAEIVNAVCAEEIRALRTADPVTSERVVLQHESEEWRKRALREVIAASDCVVSTLSTVLLDCEIAAKPVVVYAASSVAKILRRMPRVVCFDSPSSLKAALADQPQPLDSGMLHPYDNQAFREVLDAVYHPGEWSIDEYLETVFGPMQPLNSELRWSIDFGRRTVADSIARLSNATALAQERESSERKAEAAELRAQGAESRADVLAQAKEAAERTAAAALLQVREADVRAAAAAARQEEFARQAAAAEARQEEFARQAAAAEARQAELARQAADWGRHAEELAAKIGIGETKLHQCHAELAEARRMLASVRAALEKTELQARRYQEDLVTARSENAALQLQFAEQRALAERRRLGRRLACLVSWFLPYGSVVTWRRMAYGSIEDLPLFYYPGIMKRARRLVKFVVPYGLVAVFRRSREGWIHGES